MAYMPYREWVRRLGASPPKRICCFMVRIPRGIQPNTRLRRELRAQLAGSPRFVSAVSILSACPHLSDLTGESPYKRLLLLRSVAGVGVKTRLHDAQRQSWTISIFLRRVPFRVIDVLPQCRQRSGPFSVWGTRADRGILPDISEMISAAYHSRR